MSAGEMKNKNKVVPITAGRRGIERVLTPRLRVERVPLGIEISLDWLLGLAAVRDSDSSAPAAPVDIGEHRAKKRQDGFGSKQTRENRQQ
jgi:hypothetical protein